jgi:hypothetical protein
MRFKKVLMLVASICFLCSCVSNAVTDKDHVNDLSSNGVTFAPIAHARTLELLDFISNYPGLATDTQKAVFLDISQALEKHPNDIKLLIQQGGILAIPNSVTRDPNAAQALLQSLLDRNALTESDTSLVKLLLNFTQDQNIQNAKSRDEAKKHESLKQKNKALVQKLNDLKNIEKTMIERNIKSINNP